MMSMSLYRPNKAKVQPATTVLVEPLSLTSSVKRSNSMPLHNTSTCTEPMIPISTSGIPDENRQTLSPFPLADSFYSTCNGGEEYFLPMDDVDSTEESNRRPMQNVSKRIQKQPQGQHHHYHQQQQGKQQQQQQRNAAAIARLEEFFLGDSSINDLKPSPTSVVDGTRQAAVPKRNIFGQIMEDDVIPQRSNGIVGQIRRGDDHPTHYYHDDVDDLSSIGTKETNQVHHPTFTRLQLCDRAQSLPIDFTNDLPLITKKPSLKKISSIGTGMSQKKDSRSEGTNLSRTVSFSSLSIREYPPALSDNPSCSYGPPVQLDWTYEAEATHPIDRYEESRQPRRASRDLLLSYYDRRFLLIQQAGYSRQQVKEAMKAAERGKRERMLTDLFLPAQALDETMETIVDTVKRFFSKSNGCH